MTGVSGILLLVVFTLTGCAKSDGNSWNCSNGFCFERTDDSGSFNSESECIRVCSGRALSYDCSGTCLPRSNNNGAYATWSDCLNACGDGQEGYTCAGTSCIHVTQNAEYLTLESCNLNCGEEGYNCDHGTCYTIVNGAYATLEDCEFFCQ